MFKVAMGTGGLKKIIGFRRRMSESEKHRIPLSSVGPGSFVRPEIDPLKNLCRISNDFKSIRRRIHDL
uniref:Uncharacterized protein n=1 Tax=Knipowitschia caucasica TaxID=637954 RepID=A0AAV2L477_KNICA